MSPRCEQCGIVAMPSAVSGCEEPGCKLLDAAEEWWAANRDNDLWSGTVWSRCWDDLYPSTRHLVVSLYLSARFDAS